MCELRFAILLVLVTAEPASLLTASEIQISPGDDVEAIARSVSAGDTIVLRNGTWPNAVLKFERLPGTKDLPITIEAQTAGQVVLTGKVKFRVSGQHVVVQGLVFRDCDESDPCEFRTHSERLAEDCRITECVFEQTESFEAKKESRWLSIYGWRNRVDHCYFAGKKSRGTTLVVWVNETPQFHRIDHNHFGPRPVLGKNGGETIRIGTSQVSELTSQTVVEDNYFFACDGEAEVVSNKSCDNTYRHNVFVECAGALTLRHGHRCVVDSNVFLGHKKPQTGGVRIIGSGHVVTNNYFESLRGDAERAAVSMMNAVDNSKLNEYAAVTDALVAHNSFFDCKVSLELGVGAGRKQSVAPRNCTISHNVFAPDKWQIARVHAPLNGFDWNSNKLQAGRPPRDSPATFEQLKMKFLRNGSDEVSLLRPTSNGNLTIVDRSLVKTDIDGETREGTAVCGCDVPSSKRRTMASAKNTGPVWRRKLLTSGQ